MTAKVTIPNTFATATTAIPLSQLDANFSNVSSTINNALTYSNYAADTGTANNYAITITGQTTTYAAGIAFQFKAANTNTGASTLNVNAQGTQSIVRTDGTALAAGDIIANGIVSVMYDGTNFQLMNDAGGKSESFTNITVTGNANASNVYVSSLTSGRVVYAGTSGQLVDSANLTFNGTTLTANTVVSTEQATIDGMAIGQGAGNVATNTAVGVSALAANTTGANNTAVGYQALDANTTGDRNTAVGKDALGANTTGRFNTAFGYEALLSSTASGLTAIGYDALANNTTGANNVAVGFEALVLNTTASNNTAVGYQALYANTTGANNTAVGAFALDACTTGAENTAVGVNTLTSSTTAIQNTAIGRYAADGTTTGQENVFVGYGSGANSGVRKNTTGSRNVFIGAVTEGSGSTISDEIAIGYNLIAKGANTAFIGGTSGAYNGGNTTTWTTTSDRRIKKNIVDNNEGLEKIVGIRVRNFEYRLPEEVDGELTPDDAVKKTGIQLGVIAQELQQICPDCVTEQSTGVLSVNTDEIFWHMVNAIKQLKAEIDQLKGN